MSRISFDAMRFPPYAQNVTSSMLNCVPGLSLTFALLDDIIALRAAPLVMVRTASPRLTEASSQHQMHCEPSFPSVIECMQNFFAPPPDARGTFASPSAPVYAHRQ